MYESAIEQIQTEKEEVKPFRLATVSALFSDGCPKITFFGEEAPSEKKYKVIDDTSYVIGDAVLVGIINDGYVIMGAVGYNPASGGGGAVYLTEAQANLLFATKDHTHSGYASSSHTHSGYASSSHTHSDYANSDHKHNKIYTNPSSSGGGSSITLSDSGLIPTSTWAPPLGNSTYKYGQIYSTNSSISTSDENEKHDIEDMDERYELLLKLLKPIRYKYNNGTSDRYHTGFISQGVEKAMSEADISDLEFAAFIKSPKEDDDGNLLEGHNYGLRYEEFIALNTMMIQKLLVIVEEQEKRLLQLEGRINNE